MEFTAHTYAAEFVALSASRKPSNAIVTAAERLVRFMEGEGKWT